MTTIQKIILLTLLSLLPSSYFVLKATSSTTTNKIIKIEPIKIESINKTKEVKKITEDSPETILQELKSAVVMAKDKSKPSKQEAAEEILAVLKAYTSKKVIKPTTSRKKITQKRATHQKSSKEQKRKHKIKQLKIKKRVKKNVTQKKTTHKKNLKKKQAKIKKTIKKKKRKKALKIRKRVVKVTPKKERVRKKTKEQKNQTFQNFQNLPEVKTLGRVSETEAYEVSNIIPQKIELAYDAVVELPTGSIETQELKNLKEVTTLGVIEITPAFESIEAERYNLIKR